ncbi:MAG TPA: TROVE domain-containing protein [Chitinophagales bacterium]|nr:TROVE domain-containing protein [Chitinophagales bacterium]
MKFNLKLKKKNVVKNYEGAEAFVLTPQLELYTAVVTASLSNKFYEKNDTRVKRIRELMARNDPKFIAKLAVYTREKMYLRSVPLVLAVELAKITKGETTLSNAVERIVQRADEITELLAYYELANERKGTKKLNKLSKQIQKGLAATFNKFDEYQFAKYNRDAAIKLRDALFIIHPKAKDETQQVLFNKIASDGLNVPYTWETELSALGQVKFENEKEKQAAFKAKWEELITSGKIGYMALLRNLRNILEAGVSKEVLKRVCDSLSNENAVLKSKQLPFRFLSAYRELEKLNENGVTKVMNALEQAVQFTSANISGFDDEVRVLIAVDFSGSMQSPVSQKSKVQKFEIGAMLAMLLQNKCGEVTTGIFGQTWKVINVPHAAILSNTAAMVKRIGEVGLSTNGYLVIKDLIERKKIVDKVMIFTDCQLWDDTSGGTSIAKLWSDYKKLAPFAKIYLFDLAGYGNTPLNTKGNDVFLIAGWSDKIFDVLAAIENGSNAVAEIENTRV